MTQDTKNHLTITMAAILAIAIFGAIYSLNSADRSFWAENEAYYALGARSVLSGNWLLPEVYPGKFADKPPLTFWWVAGVSRLFGAVTEWTARLANMLAALGVMGALFFWGRRMVHPMAALLAILMLGTTYEFWETALEVNTDIPLLALLTVAWGAMFFLMTKRGGWLLWGVFWGAQGLGLLTKGPVMLVLSGLVAVAFAINRSGVRTAWPTLLRLRPFAGVLLALLPFAAWLAAVWIAKGFEPVRVIIIEHNVERFVSAFDHERPWHYYFHQTPAGMLPWSIVWPFAFWFAFRERRRAGRLTAPQAFSLCVMATVFVFFSLSSSKRDYYLLPILPWAALLSGDFLWRRISAASDEAMDFRAALRLVRRSAAGMGFATLLGVMLAAMTVYSGFITDMIDARKTPKTMADSINRAVDGDDHLALLDERDPRLLYYLREHFDLFDDDEQDIRLLDEWLRSHPEVDLIVGEGDLEIIIDSFYDLNWFIQDKTQFRDDSYYLLTTESNAEGEPLIGLPVENPSGLCYHPARGTLFAVGENGEIAEMTLDGRTLQKSHIAADFEAITDDAEGFLLAVDEAGNKILKINPDGLELMAQYSIEADEAVELKPLAGNDGLEGLCFMRINGSGRLFAVNESDPPLLLEMALEPGAEAGQGRAVIVDSHKIDVKDLGELAMLESKGDQPRLIVLSKDSGELVEIDLDGQVLRRVNLDGEDQEAVAVGPGGVVFHSGRNQRLMTMHWNGVK